MASGEGKRADDGVALARHADGLALKCLMNPNKPEMGS